MILLLFYLKNKLYIRINVMYESIVIMLYIDNIYQFFVSMIISVKLYCR